MAAARHVRIALFFHPKLNTTASSPSPGTQSLKRCALSQETELPGTHPIPTIGLLPIFPPAPTPTPPLHATQHFVQEALFIGFAMNKALSIGQQDGRFAGTMCSCWRVCGIFLLLRSPDDFPKMSFGVVCLLRKIIAATL